MKKLTVQRTERGWAGHFCAANSCRFRRNTLLECGNTEIVVSTVGVMENALRGKGKGFEEQFTQVGLNRYFETMAFHAKKDDTRYHDADVSRQVSFDSDWAIDKLDADDNANEMHEAVVAELTAKLASGELTDG